MPIRVKAFLYGEGGGFFHVLKEFLYKRNLHETQNIKDTSDLTEHLLNGVWPIIFIDGDENSVQDTFYKLDNMYSKLGFEHFSYVLTLMPDDNQHIMYHKSMMASGCITKPLQPIHTKALIDSILIKSQDIGAELAMQVLANITKEDYDSATSNLTRLSANPKFTLGAEIALLRIETITQQFSKAEVRFVKLLKNHPNNLRVLCEICDFYLKSNQYENALKCLRKINTPKVLPHRIWQQICVHLEIDELDEAATLLDDLSKFPNYREHSADTIARMMIFMGIERYVPNFVKLYPSTNKAYNLFISKYRKAP